MKAVAEAFKKVLSFLGRRERILVLEILCGLIRASFFKVNFEKKIVDLIQINSEKYDQNNNEEIISVLKRVLKRFGKLERYRIVVGLDPAFATTVQSSVVLMRDKPKEPVDDSDLDNRIAQGIWRLFDRYRGKAAAKMKVSDLDVMLIDVKVKQIKLDGHKIVNPIGFKAKTIEIQFSQTFSPRNFSAMIKEVVPKAQLVFMSEAGTVEAEVLGKATGSQIFMLVELLFGQGNVFFSDGSTIACLRTIDWGGKNLTTSIAEAFSVSAEVAERMLAIYLKRQASAPVLKRVHKLLFDEFSKLAELISDLVVKYRIPMIYIFPFFDVPEFVFGDGFRAQMRLRPKILPVNHHLITEKLGFYLKSKREAIPNTIFSAFSHLLGFYFSPDNDKMNKIARKHARWLIS